MCVYVCACVCVRIYKYIYTYICINIYIHISIHILCVCIYIFMYLHIHIYKLYVYMYLYIYIYIYTYAYIDQPTHTSTIITTSYLFAREPSHCVASDKLIIHTLSPLFMHVHTTKAHVNISENCKGLYGVATISRLLKLTGLFCRI